MQFFNLLLANIPILCPLKTPENLWFSGVFGGYKIGTLASNGLNQKKEKFRKYREKKKDKIENVRNG